MRNPSTHWIVAILVAFALAVAGCGDGNLFEGQSDSSGDTSDLEAGLAALDSSDWREAQRIFSGMDQSDPDVRKYLASAYVGEAGFDMLRLIEEIDAAQDMGGSDDIVYDIITGIFDDGDGMLTPAELSAKVDLVAQALAALGAWAPDVGPAARTAAAVTRDTILPENEFQAGIYGAVYAVMVIVEQLVDPLTEELLLTLAALENTEADVCEIIGPVPADVDDGYLAVPAAFDDLLQLVRVAVQSIEPDYMGGQFDNDVAEELDAFLTEIGYLPDESVSDTELRGYLYGLFDNTCTL